MTMMERYNFFQEARDWDASTIAGKSFTVSFPFAISKGWNDVGNPQSPHSIYHQLDNQTARPKVVSFVLYWSEINNIATVPAGR